MRSKFIWKKKVVFLQFLLLFSNTLFVSAQNLSSSFDTYMNAESTLYGFNGNVLVAKSGKIIYQRSFGFADYGTKKMLTQFTGKYMIPLTIPPYMTNFPVEIIEKNNALYLHPFRGKDIELKAETSNQFFYGDGTDQQLIFQKDSNGNIFKVWHVGWGVKKEIKKI